MKHNCDVIRDLMPLCAENAASEASRSMLTDHLVECKDCANAYSEMQTELPREPIEHPAMAEKMKLLQRVHQRRKRRSILIGVLIGVLAVVGLAMLIDANRHWLDYSLSVDQYDILLSRRTNGDVIITRKQYIDQIAGWSLYVNEGVWIFQMNSNWLSDTLPENLRASSMRDDDLLWVEGEGLYEERLLFDEEQGCYVICRFPVEEIWLAKEMPNPNDWTGEKLLYRRGDDIPLVSPELEALISNEDMYRGTRTEYWEERLRYYEEQRQQDEKRDTYRETRETIIQSIPEWQ